MSAAGVCRLCRCTDDRACDLGHGLCAWANEEHTLCTACVGQLRGQFEAGGEVFEVYSPGTFGPEGLGPLSPIWKAVFEHLRAGTGEEQLFLPFGPGSK